MSSNEGRRVVITGLGLIAPNGIGLESFWKNSLTAQCFIEPISRFNASPYTCRVAGQVQNFRATDYLHSKTIKQTDRSTHMAMACCQMAATDADLRIKEQDPEELGMFFANTFGGMEFAEPELYAQKFLGVERVSAYQAIAWFYAATQGQWSIHSGIHGYGKSIVADRTGGSQALAWATLAIRRGHCNLAFAGGFEAPLVPYAFLVHQTSRLLSANQNPRRAYLPFNLRRNGLVLAEGSAVLVVEELGHALRRRAPIYAEVSGYSVSCDSHDPSDPAPDGAQLARCISDALKKAGVTPDDVDHVSADGLATDLGDSTEALALNRVFGACNGSGPTVSVPKAMIGHTLAAAGAIDAAWACMMIKEQIVLPTIGLDCPDPLLRLKHVREAPQKRELNSVLCCSRGHGGLNSALVLQKY